MKGSTNFIEGIENALTGDMGGYVSHELYEDAEEAGLTKLIEFIKKKPKVLKFKVYEMSKVPYFYNDKRLQTQTLNEYLKEDFSFNAELIKFEDFYDRSR